MFLRISGELATFHEQNGPFGILSPRRVIVGGSEVSLLPELQGPSELGTKQWAFEHDKFMDVGFDYFAPELLTATVRSRIPADVYSLGAVLAYLLSGKHAFEGMSFAECALDKTLGPIRIGVGSTLAKRLSPMIEKMTSPSPIERFQSVREVLASVPEHLE